MSKDSESSLELACPQCQKKLKVPSQLAGKKVKCPGCGGAVKVLGVAPQKVDPDDWLNLDMPAVQLDNFKPQDVTPPSAHGWENRKKGTSQTPSMPKVADPSSQSSPNKTGGKPATPIKPAASNPLATNSPQTPSKPKEPASSPPKSSAPTPKSNAPKNGQSSGSSFDDDDFPSLMPEEPREVPKWTLDFEGLDGVDLLSSKPKEPSNPSKASKAWADSFEEENEFRVKCNICGTLSYAFESQIGKKINCVDCHSDFVVPPPPSGWKRTKSPTKQKRTDSDGHESEFKLLPPEKLQVPERNLSELTAADVLHRAQKEVDEEAEEDMQSVYDFDSSGWLKRTFSFVFDFVLLAIAIGTGFVLSGVLYAGSYFGALAEMTQGVSRLIQIMVVVVGCIPIMGVTLANGLAILQAAANRMKVVHEWPLFNPADWMEESLCVICAFVLSILPGATLGGILQSMGQNTLLTSALMIVSSWLLLPLLLLSMLDNQSLFQPFSGEVFGSLSKKMDSWGGYYLVSAVGAFMLFIMVAFALSSNGTGVLLAGMSIPLFLFFLFHQMGILAASISDVTDLGFEAEAPVSDPK